MMNYEQFFFWLRGYLDAYEIDDQTELGEIYTKMCKIDGDEEGKKFDTPRYPDDTFIKDQIEVSNSLVDRFADSYNDLPIEDLPTFGVDSVEDPLQEWKAGGAISDRHGEVKSSEDIHIEEPNKSN